MIHILVTTVNGFCHTMWMPLDTLLIDCSELPEGVVSVEILSVEY